MPAIDSETPIGLYIHIPFCLTKCNYCDFNTYEGLEHLIPALVKAVQQELEFWGGQLGNPRIATLFLGGGTPSYIPSEHIQRILDTARRNMRFKPNIEATIEANPDDIDVAKLHAWLNSGINRISIGVQSFNDKTLARLGRRHNAQNAVDAVQRARDAGFGNISIDLMYGLPHQTMAEWDQTLDIAARLETDHLSVYGLQIELGTPLHQNVANGITPAPSDDLAADMYEVAIDTLQALGYRHYEISNWAKSGKESQHNLTYWLNEPYLGIGPGAHSSLRNTRFANVKSPRKYIEAIREFSAAPLSTSYPQSVDFIEETTPAMSISETMMLGMRLEHGIDLLEFQRRYGRSAYEFYAAEIEKLTALGLIEQIQNRIRLTQRGKLLGNEVFQQFILTGQ